MSQNSLGRALLCLSGAMILLAPIVATAADDG